MDSVNTSLGLTPLTKALLDQLPQGAILLDRMGAVRYANPIARATVGGMIEGAKGHSAGLMPKLEALGGESADLVDDAGDGPIAKIVFLPTVGPTESLAERERRAILSALYANNWRLAATAKELGISRTTLWRRLKTYGIERDGPRVTEPDNGSAIGILGR